MSCVGSHERFKQGALRKGAIVALVLGVIAPSLLAVPLRASHQQIVPSTPSGEGKSAPNRLEPGKTLEQALAGGESHSYEIQVATGQFLHAVVDQLGVDVALTLYGPDGKKIASMDSPNGAFGLEQISTIAEAAGIYRLEVVSDDKSAPAGRYRVTVNPLRAPSDQDRARISAERIFFEAGQVQAQGSADSLRDAIQKYVATLPLWRSAGDAYEEVLTLNNIGRIYSSQGEKQKALDYYALALPLERGAHDPDDEAETLNDIGLVYDDLGKKQEALDWYTSALTLWRAVGDARGEASTLGNAGIVYLSQGDQQKALNYFFRALTLLRALGDHGRESVTLSNIGAAYDALGEMQKALEYYAQSLALTRALADGRGEAVTLNNIAAVYSSLGENQKALEYLSLALPLNRQAGDRGAEANTLNSIGHIHFVMGENQKALVYFFQSLPIERAVGDRLRESVALSNIGAAYDAMGERRKALEYYDQALTLERTVRFRAGEAGTLRAMGKVYDELNRRQEALDSLGQALALFRQISSPLSEGHTLQSLMEHWKQLGNPGLAIFFGKQAINKIQQIRANILGLEYESRQSFLKSHQDVYRELADLLISQGRLPEAEEVLGLLKNEEYFEFIRRDGKAASSLTASVALTKDESEVNRKYEENANRITAIGNEWAVLRAKPSRTPEEEKRLADISDQLKLANEEWGKFLSGLYAEFGKTKQAQTTVENLKESASGMQQVVRALGAGTVALYTLVGEEKYRVIVVTPTVMVAREYPITAAELRKKVFEFRQALVNPKSDPVPQAQELYRILVGPVAQDIQGAKAVTLMWSLDEVLRYLPMAALHDGHQYMVEKYRNTVFTPASVAELTERPNVKNWQGLGMGVSKSYGQFPALPAVPEELRRVIREASEARPEGVLPGEVMLDEKFTEASMKKALEHKYPLVHIASHFDFQAGNETNSFLLLGGTDVQGTRLTLAEIREDPGFTFADTELLTLSACDTAVGGTQGDGREVDGLGILAQQKGAKAVVASLWGVSDASTGLLMQDFYREWTTHPKMPKAEALRLAQVALLRGKIGGSQESGNRGVKKEGDEGKTASGGNHSNGKNAVSGNYSHPYYWAPFILIGNWR